MNANREPRISLTPKQCALTEGQELIGLLCEITHGGLVNENCVQQLNVWLEKHADSDIPAVKYLSQFSKRFEEITTETAFEIHFAIERVLPKSFREEVKQRRQEAWVHSPLHSKASEAQLDYIRGLGKTPPAGINSAEASYIISELLGETNFLLSEKATQDQIQKIHELGGNLPVGLTKFYASMLIEQLLHKQNR